MYGKLQSKPQRKLGHVNIIDKDNLGIEKLLEQVKILQNDFLIEAKKN